MEQEKTPAEIAEMSPWQKEILIKIFNELYYDFKIVKYRFIQGDFIKIVKLTRQSWAYIRNGIPTAIFCETGPLSIEPKFVIYPECHICFKQRGNFGEFFKVIELSEEEAKNYKGYCEFDYENNICRTCNRSIKEIKREERNAKNGKIVWKQQQ